MDSFREANLHLRLRGPRAAVVRATGLELRAAQLEAGPAQVALGLRDDVDAARPGGAQVIQLAVPGAQARREAGQADKLAVAVAIGFAARTQLAVGLADGVPQPAAGTAPRVTSSQTAQSRNWEASLAFSRNCVI